MSTHTTAPDNTNSHDRFQILSLDGGGIKGLFSAGVLAAIEEDLGARIIDHFDLITGTSTGGIIAIGLGLGMKPREIVEFYLREGPAIFPSRLGTRLFQHVIYRKFSARPLRKALERCFKDRTFGSSMKPLVIPAYNLGADDVYLFRTPHYKNLKRDYKVLAWKVALATASAPTFFPCSREIDNLRLIDGGVWANNPVMVGIVEAHRFFDVPLTSMRVLSIGTSEPVSYRRQRLNSGGVLAWALGNAAIDVILRGQSIAAHNQARLLIGKENIERVSPKVASGEFSLAGVHKVEDLLARAAHDSRAFSPMFEQTFRAHTARPFSPLFQ